MTEPGPDHARFDELAAGHALHTLEAIDELRFLAHAEDCPHCEQALADYADITAALAETAPPAEPSPELGTRILAAARSTSRGEDHPGGLSAGRGTAAVGDPEPAADAQVIPLWRRPRPRWLNAAAAAAVVVIAGGTWAGLAATSSGGAPQPLAACGHPHACPEVQLTDADTRGTAAQVIVDAGSAWLQPATLPADRTADQIYVLWQVTGTNTPLPVGSFDVRVGAHGPIRVGTLAASYRSTKGFAVSLEHGRAIPARPSDIVAQGRPAD